MRVQYLMPSSTTVDSARTIGAACGLTLTKFEGQTEGNWKAVFACEGMMQVEAMDADLGYKHDAILAWSEPLTPDSPQGHDEQN